MPNRIIREGILTSERVNWLEAPAEVFYRRLLSKVDDHGLYDARPAVLRAALYPLRLDRVREADISRWIAECEKAGLIVLYEAEGKNCLKAMDTRWKTRSEPKYPLPPPTLKTVARNCEQLNRSRCTLSKSETIAAPGGAEAAPKAPEKPRTDVQTVVLGFKDRMGAAEDDQGWDRVYFPRFSKPAKELLVLLGDVGTVLECIDQVTKALGQRNLSWTPETVVKHASDWKNGRLFK